VSRYVVVVVRELEGNIEVEAASEKEALAAAVAPGAGRVDWLERGLSTRGSYELGPSERLIRPEG